MRMTEASYPAARAVAPKVQEHFALQIESARKRNHQDLAPEPDAAAVEAMTDAAFWASLRRDESYVATVSMAYLPPAQAGQPLKFEQPLPLTPDTLTRLAPAVKQPGIHLGVWREEGKLGVWGAAHTIPTLCLVVEVVAPGLLVIKHPSGLEVGKFVNVAVLEGDQVKLLDAQGINRTGFPPLLALLLGLDPPETQSNAVNVLLQLAASMRAHRRGGSLLVVPSRSQTWLESVVHPIAYQVSPPFAEVAGLLKENSRARRHRLWEGSLRRALDAIAGLTAVDGATVITDQYELLAFGAKITRRDGFPQVERIAVAEPIVGATARVVHPGYLGGTRHMSAAQFGHDQRDAIALVASQDGRFTVFAWSPQEEIVHAHRVEAFLL